MRKKIFICIILVLVLLIFIKVLWGHLYLKFKIPYDNPIYKLEVNNDLKGMNMEIQKVFTIVPNTFSIVSTAHVFTEPSKFTIQYGEEINMDIKGYYCFSNLTGKERSISCNNYNHPIMKEINNISLKKMKIYGGSSQGLTNNLIYDGEFQKNITHLITKKGYYQIELNLEHEKIKSDLIFIIEIK